MYPYTAQQGSPVLTTQAPSPVIQQSPSPYYAAVQPTQAFDFSSIINMMIPLLGLMMIFGMVTPMMKSMGKGFGGD